MQPDTDSETRCAPTVTDFFVCQAPDSKLLCPSWESLIAEDSCRLSRQIGVDKGCPIIGEVMNFKHERKKMMGVIDRM